MAKERAAIGEALMRKVDGDRVTDNLLAAYAEIAPEFSRYLLEFAFGEIYAREGDLKQRELVAIASLATMGGCDAQLETHVHGAFNVGLTKAEIVEAVMTLIPYIGFPKALNAMAVVKRVVEKRSAAG
ncbi:MAG: carboxymuconolactone decarboxylase family protein [bacterium]|nr:carboxymuconolactone decarboxylase family protein [bacterium]